MPTLFAASFVEQVSTLAVIAYLITKVTKNRAGTTGSIATIKRCHAANRISVLHSANQCN